MNYVGRKDDGKYISSKQTSAHDFDRSLLHEIAYNKEIAEVAAQQKRKYREVFLEAVNMIDEDAKV